MPKIGDALKRAVEEKPPETPDESSRRRSASVLMNPNRLKIFQYLCRIPCSDTGQVAGATGLSRSSVKWHLDSLVDSGYVQESPMDGKPRYCPDGLVSLKNRRLFAVLTKPEVVAVYAAVARIPGSDVGMLASGLEMPKSSVRRCIDSLLEVEMLTVVTDGRYARYFPTERCNRVLAEERAARKSFIRHMVKRLADERLRPEVEDLKGPGTVISIKLLDSKGSLVIPAPLHDVFESS